MAENRLRTLLIADFTVENLTGLLANDPCPPAFEAATAPYDQVTPILIDPGHPAWHPKPDCAIVWTRPERASESFARLLAYEDVSTSMIVSEVDEYASQVAAIRDRARFAFVPSWTLPPYHRGRGIVDMDPKHGHAAVLAQMNLRLADRLTGIPNIFLLDAQRWVTRAGHRAANPKLWFMGKVAFGSEVFTAAAADIRAAVNGLLGLSRKLVVVDLDDTLWGGILGDAGRDNLILGGHDPHGEAYAAFQKALLALTRRGVLLGIVSKNQEETALDAIDSHPEMILRRRHFAGWRINWQDKAQNLVELVRELNLGLQSVVFIDDNPAERDRVRGALPEVLVPDWPDDPLLFASTLEALDCFDAPTTSAEDRLRAEMYAVERERKDLMRNIGCVDDWLAGLEMKVKVEPLTGSNRDRTVQLLNKTNQMNLSTRRLTAGELDSWLAHPHRRLWTFRVSDKFGDAGLTGILSCEVNDDTASIIDFVLSCRVMGRKVEETMLRTAVTYARGEGAGKVIATPVSTAKNLPCRDFFARSGFTYEESTGAYIWSTAEDYPLPRSVTLEG